MDKVDSIYKNLRRKYHNSNFWFIFLNVTAFFLTAIVVILNLFAIRYNPAKAGEPHANSHIMWMFITVSVLSGLAGLVSAFMSFMVFRKRAFKIEEIIENIKTEEKLYKKRIENYTENDRDKVFIQKVNKILNS